MDTIELPDIEDQKENVENNLIRKEDKETLIQILSTLSEEEQQVIEKKLSEQTLSTRRERYIWDKIKKKIRKNAILKKIYEDKFI